MTTSKETNKAPITNLKGIKIYELSDIEFRIIFLRKFSKLQKQKQKHKQTLGKIRKTTHEQNEMFDKKITTIKTKTNRKRKGWIVYLKQ